MNLYLYIKVAIIIIMRISRESKQARGPNTLNLNSYANIQIQKVTDQEVQNYSDHPAIEEQFDNFVREIQQYDQILSKIAKNVSQVSTTNFITDFYPQSILNTKYDMDEEKKIVASTDQQMAKILTSLERNNSTLKQQLRGWYFEYAKKTRLTQLLISQNKLLRKYVCNKNKQTIKLIDTINKTQNQELMALQVEFEELKQENSILADHLKQMKVTIKDKKNQQMKLIKSIQQSFQTKFSLESRLLQMEDKQEHTSKYYTLNSQSQKQHQLRHKYLQAERTRLLNLKEQYLQDEQSIRDQMQKYHIDQREVEQLLRERWDKEMDLKDKIMNDIEQQSERYQYMNKLNKNLAEEIGRNQSKIAEYTKINTDLDRKISENQQSLQSKQKQLAIAFETSASIMAQMDILDFQSCQYQANISEKKQQYHQTNQKLEKLYSIFESQRRDEVHKWSKQFDKVRREATNRKIEENNNIQLKKKQIQYMQKEIANKCAYIQNLAKQIQEIKGKRITVNQKIPQQSLVIHNLGPKRQPLSPQYRTYTQAVSPIRRQNKEHV